MRLDGPPRFVAATVLEALRAVDRSLATGSLENARGKVLEAERRRSLMAALEPSGRSSGHPHRGGLSARRLDQVVAEAGRKYRFPAKRTS